MEERCEDHYAYFEKCGPEEKTTLLKTSTSTERLDYTCKWAQDNLNKSQVKYKNYYDRRAKDNIYSG